MGIFKSITKAIEKSSIDIFAKSPVETVVIEGIQLRCPHCGGTTFQQGKSQLNTAGLSTLDIELVNQTVSVYRCIRCKRLEWFDNYDADEWARTH